MIAWLLDGYVMMVMMTPIFKDHRQDEISPYGMIYKNKLAWIRRRGFFCCYLMFSGYLKCTLRTPTVTMIDRVTRTMVKRRYLPSSGTAKLVGGMISASRRKNTVSDSRIEMHRVTFSPESEGR